MTQILKRFLIGTLAVVASGASAQQVEYVTRNVQPTHAVRFSSQPIRITLTDRGFRAPLASSPVVRHGKFCRSARIGRHGIHHGVIVIRDRDDDRAQAAPPRPRTVYGRDRSRDRAQSRSEAAASSPVPAAKSEADRRHLLRCLSLIQARKQRVDTKPAEPAADDR